MNTTSTQPLRIFEAARENTAALAEELQCRLDQMTDAALMGIDEAEALSLSFQGGIAALRTNLVHVADKLRRHLGGNSSDLLHTASTSGDTSVTSPARTSHPDC